MVVVLKVTLVFRFGPNWTFVLVLGIGQLNKKAANAVHFVLPSTLTPLGPISVSATCSGSKDASWSKKYTHAFYHFHMITLY